MFKFLINILAARTHISWWEYTFVYIVLSPKILTEPPAKSFVGRFFNQHRNLILVQKAFFVNTLPELYPGNNDEGALRGYCTDCAHIYTYEKHVNQKINYKIFKNLNNVYNMALILLKQKLTNCSFTMAGCRLSVEGCFLLCVGHRSHTGPWKSCQINNWYFL